MPTIPTYDGPQVRNAPLQGGYLDANAFGAAPGRQLAQAGEGLQKAAAQGMEFAVRAQEREDADAAFRAETNLKAEYLQFEQGLRKRQGVDAKGALTDTEKWWSDAESRFNEGLNDRQRRLLAQSAVRLRQQSVVSVGSYENAQLERSHDESWAASKTTTISAAAATPRPEVISAAVGELEKKNAYQGARKGWTPEQLAAENLKDTTTLHTNVVRGLLSQPNGAKAAQEYFDRHAGQINGTVHDEIKPLLQKGVREQEATEKATSMAGMPLEQGLAEIAKIQDPELRKAVHQQFMLNKRDEELVVQARERAASDKVWQSIANGKKPSPADLAAMNGRERIQVEQYYDAKAKAAAQGGKLHAREDNYEALDMAEAAIKRGDITTPQQLERYAPFLRAETFRTLRKSLEKRGEVPRGEVEKVFLDRLGKSKAKMTPDERKQWVAFQDYINENVRETKRPEDLEAWADRWFMSGYGKNDSIFRNDPDTYGQARTAGRKDFLIPVPEDRTKDVDASLAILRAGGVKVPSGKAAADEFYTNYYLDAQRWFDARGEQASPGRAAAYAILKQNNKPVTPANINAVLQQLKGAASAGPGKPAR